AGNEIGGVVQVVPRAGHALHVRLPAQPAVAAHFAGHPRHLGCEGAKLVHHGVDRVLQFQNLTLHIDGDLARQVAGGDGLGHVGDVADLAGEVAGHEVDVVRQVVRGAGHTFDIGLRAEIDFGAGFTGLTRHFRGEGAKLIDHGVNGVFQLQNLAFDIDGDLFRQVAVGHGGGDLGDVADLAGEIAGHEV